MKTHNKELVCRCKSGHTITIGDNLIMIRVGHIGDDEAVLRIRSRSPLIEHDDAKKKAKRG